MGHAQLYLLSEEREAIGRIERKAVIS